MKANAIHILKECDKCGSTTYEVINVDDLLAKLRDTNRELTPTVRERAADVIVFYLDRQPVYDRT